MPNDKISALVGRLGMNLADFYMSYLDDNDSGLQKIKDLYNLIRTSRLAEANALISTMKFDDLSTDYQRLFYSFCEINLNILTNRVPKSMGNEQLLALIDYPTVLKKKHINFVELVALESTSSFLLNDKNDDKSLIFLYNKLSDSNYEFKGLNFMVLPSIYANLSKTFIIKESYSEALTLINEGLRVCKKYETYNSMANLLYYEAYCYKKINRDSLIQPTLEKLKTILLIEDNEKKSNHYLNSISKNF